ncbi:inositol monophosphatase family protein [Mangrovibrevibacter kandeliae]|uniref:inositol monophosphatase family protein n=1 Tax=Mangrovibrevibacter kandeliae TaxID=2968473 RepID=UPI002119ACF8|nr:inositol monophosphatase family protein [Aurantimonas sp. CSK15Z-1]MCQ8782763.1 inositol monophosphatase [Aurantimonas sp. CSK15Z-1]
MNETIDVGRLADILRRAAAAEVLPRFRRLGAGDIRRKTSAIDLVTEADEAAERFIRNGCAALWPDAVFVGEESVAADKRLLEAVGTADLCIVVDPIDGTANYAAGAPLFAVMAAVVAKGETVAGAIYDPMGDDVMLAERGGGAWHVFTDGRRERLTVADPVPVADMVGSIGTTHFAPQARHRLVARLDQVRIAANYRCSGHEYRLAASGGLHFLCAASTMPWDHLAGALIAEEAGGHLRRLDGSPYRPGHVEGGILLAPGAESWRELQTALFPEGVDLSR